jgi:hypothetical protein
MRTIPPLRWSITAAVAAIGLTMLAGCATLAEGSAQTIRIETDPSGASCELTRKGQLVTRIPATPSTISQYKESGDLKLTCRKRGYLDASLDTASDFQNMVLGNILFGGLIGVFVDMGSGATSKYPESITLTLVPETFASEAERDAYFAALRHRLAESAEQRMAEARSKCAEENCDQQLKQLREALQRQLEFLETQKAATRIEPPAS